MEKELRFISNCFNINYQVKSKKILEDLANKNLNWDFILKTLIKSYIGPLAFRNLSSFKNNKIPLFFMSALRKNRYYSLVKNLFIQKTLNDTLTLFYNEKIPAIALKGLFMGGIIYEDISLRTLSDIDILVKKIDLQKIDFLLKQNGYIKTNEYFGISYIKNVNMVRSSFEKVLLEIHCNDLNLPHPISITDDFLWDNVITKNMNGLPVQYPSLENALIYTALHFFHHFSEAFMYHHCHLPKLKFILDIHEIISLKQSEIDWEYVLEFSKKTKTRYVLYLSIYLSKLYFNTRVPQKIMDKIRPSFLRICVLHLFLKNYINIQSLEGTKYIYRLMLEKPFFKQKLLISINSFAKEHKLPYPSIKTYCLYLLRPFLLLFYLKKCS